jgi:hypothetical protein
LNALEALPDELLDDDDDDAMVPVAECMQGVCLICP